MGLVSQEFIEDNKNENKNKIKYLSNFLFNNKNFNFNNFSIYKNNYQELTEIINNETDEYKMEIIMNLLKNKFKKKKI